MTEQLPHFSPLNMPAQRQEHPVARPDIPPKKPVEEMAPEPTVPAHQGLRGSALEQAIRATLGGNRPYAGRRKPGPRRSGYKADQIQDMSAPSIVD